jgi:hypothetical protein
MIIQTIYKLGADVKRSARWFIGGIVLALVAGGFIALGYYYQHQYQIIGLGLLAPAALSMGYGYIGILANRIAQIIKGIKDKRERNKRLYGDD